jgi:hypothetical protein
MSKLNLIFYRMTKEQAIVSELHNYYSGSDDHSVEYISNESEANQYLPAVGSGIFLFEVKSKTDLQAAVNVLKNQKKLIKSGLLKPSCVLHINNKKIEKILAKYGCVDLLEPTIRSKTLSFKIDFWSRALKTLIVKEEKAKELKSKNEKSKSKSDAKEKKKEDFIYVAPLKIQSDIWLVKSKTDCKKILRRWLLRILGPSPHAGKWIELEPQPGDKLPTWKFTIPEDNGKFITEDGSWFFYGSKPEFDWKLKRWNFSSDLPHLYFYSSDGQVFSRFKFVDGSMEVAENSRYAQAKEEYILETCETNFSFEGDEAEDEESKNLEGDNDSIDSNMEGDVKDGAEDLNGNLTGKLDSSLTEEDNENKRSSFEEDAIDGHMGGKSSTDQLDNSALSGSVKPGSAKEKEDSRSNFKEDELPGHMGGKSSTDQLDNSALSGSIKPGSAKEKEDSRSNFKEDELPGHMGGKGSTDQLDNSALSGSIKPGSAKEKEDSRSNFEEDAIAGHMGGKSSTDEVNRAPLSGAVKPGVAKEKEDNKSEFEEDAIAGHLGGKTKNVNPNNSDTAKPLGKDDSFDPPHKLTQEEFDKLPQAEKDELTRAGIGIIAKDKDGNPIVDKDGKPVLEKPNTSASELTRDDSFDPPHKLTQEEFDKLPQAEKDELTRAGIGIIAKDKDGNPILDKDGKPAIKITFRKKPLPDIKGNNDFIEKAKPDIRNPFGKKPQPEINGNNDLENEKNKKDTLDPNTEIGKSASSVNNNPLSRSITATSDKEASMEEALGGGIAEASSGNTSDNEYLDLQKEIGKKSEKKEFDLSKIIDGKVEVSTESGELKVILKQETKAGNDITFICDFEDFYTDELVVQAPKDSLPLGSEVRGKVSLKYGTQKINVVIEGSISEIEEFDDRKDTLVINVKNISQSDYDQFMSLYQDRQESIMDFMQKAKGF